MTSDTNTIIGRILGRYRILEEVGRGGMAVVYRGIDEELGREVAVKVLHSHLAGDPESRARLRREAQAVAKLRHDNILEIYDFTSAEQSESFLVTEFIRGQTLTAFLATHRIAYPEIAALVVAEMAGALSHAHAHGVIHRDVKPENVMIRDDGRVKLMDFGIAQLVDKERLTATGQLIGSPAYLAPELVEGGRVDFRTDVFSTGIVLYRLATGQLPFSGRNPHEVMKKIVDGKFVPPDQLNPMIGTQLGRIMARALARLPADRYQDMAALEGELLADAAAAGMEDTRGELSRFFADPTAWEKEARTRLPAKLVATAKRDPRRARTVALVGRALAIDPKHAGARAALDGIGRRQRAIRAAVGAGALGLVIAGGVATERHFAKRAEIAKAKSIEASRLESRRAGEEKAAIEGKLPSVSAGTGAGMTPANEAAKRAAAAREREAKARAAVRVAAAQQQAQAQADAAKAPRDVFVNVIPKSVMILVDDRPLGAWVPGAPIPLSAGPHEVEFENEHCFPKRVHVGANDRDLGTVRLGWKNATLHVTTEPPDASVEIATSTAGPRGFKAPVVNLPVRVPPESQTGRDTVTVTVTAPGFHSEQRRVTVTAGLLSETTIRLQPSH